MREKVRLNNLSALLEQTERVKRTPLIRRNNSILYEKSNVQRVLSLSPSRCLMNLSQVGSENTSPRNTSELKGMLQMSKKALVRDHSQKPMP